MFYLPFRIGFPTTVGENKVYSNETHDGQDCETEVVGAVEDDCDEEVEVARLPALRHPCGLGRGKRRTAAAAQLAGCRRMERRQTTSTFPPQD